MARIQKNYKNCWEYSLYQKEKWKRITPNLRCHVSNGESDFSPVLSQLELLSLCRGLAYRLYKPEVIVELYVIWSSQFIFTICFSLLGLLEQSTVGWVAYKQQKYIPHGCGGSKSKIRVPTWPGSTESPLSGSRLLSARFVLSSREQCGLPSVRALIPFKGSMSHDLITSQRPPNIITLGVGVATYEFWRDNKCSVHNTIVRKCTLPKPVTHGHTQYLWWAE